MRTVKLLVICTRVGNQGNSRRIIVVVAALWVKKINWAAFFSAEFRFSFKRSCKSSNSILQLSNLLFTEVKIFNVVASTDHIYKFESDQLAV